MQSVLLDILILGLLILLFAVIYRKRATTRLRFWVIGWLFVVMHFVALLFTPVTPLADHLVSSVTFFGLILSGVCFILSAEAVGVGNTRRVVVGLIMGVPPVIYATLISFEYSHHPLLNAVIIIGELGALGLSLFFFRGQRAALAACVTITFLLSAWIFYGIAHGRLDLGIYGILTQIFLLNAVSYWTDFRRPTAGVITVVSGLVAWASVFPTALFVATYHPAWTIPGELWNIPKFFVAFGMILTLLEDEIIATGRASEEYRLLFEANPLPMWIYDAQTWRFLRVNDAAVKHYGYSQLEFSEMKLQDIRPPEDATELHDTLSRDNRSLFSGPWRHLKKDGTTIQVDIASHWIDFAGSRARFVMAHDVTERQRLHEQLLHQAHHDILTGLPNRLLFADRMTQTLAGAARRGLKAAVVCIDLDRFKQVNDTYGHTVGDLCLKQVADRIRQRLREVDTVARTGGEEFTLVLSGLGDADDAQTVVQALLDTFSIPLALAGYNIDVAASIGIAMYPDDGLDGLTLWRNADAAMYRAKRSGGNQFLFVSHEISSSASEANELELSMRRMLKEGGFQVHYQPQFTLDGELCGLEALLRLDHPRFGQIQPDRFIPLAEESGLIVPIGEWVLAEVCRQSMAWQREGLPPIRIAVNVSPLQLMRIDFAARVLEICKEHELPPHLLELEMTETTMMRNLNEVAQQMQTLSRLGIQFSVDDFGTGYSSLQHLHKLPISALKVDRSFIERICDAGGTFSIVQAIMSLAHSLGMRVVAEGVEREDQMQALRSLHCDMLQGFLLSRPMPGSAIPALMRGKKPVEIQPPSQGSLDLRDPSRIITKG
jgi:diguanylate cyclase (GGDEF)-like protein/PAS domain S-box-containing protein